VKLSEQLNNSIVSYANLPALFVDNKCITYKQLADYAENINTSAISEAEQVGILSYRDTHYYSAVLACALDSRTFIPLGVKLPIARLISIIGQSNLKYVLYSKKYLSISQQLKKALPDRIFVCLDDIANKCTASTKPLHPRSLSNIAYVLFTSGSTGAPKGVPISVANLGSYLDTMCESLPLSNTDKVSQVFDPTFDLSMHDIFVTWLQGACLYVVPEAAIFAPGKFIKQHGLTVWFSVPSTASIMAKLGMLKNGVYPSLRVSQFCGEPLPRALALKWQKAAPNSKVINLYGPTEATIACSKYEFDCNDDSDSSYIPLGKALKNMSFDLDAQGELLISGPQVFSGYLNDNIKTAQCLIKTNNITHYRSGDLVKRDAQGVFHYISRVDDQVKIQGYRVELSEVNTLAQNFLSNPLVQAIATPIQQPQSLTLFICNPADIESERALIEYLKQQLPIYMVPKKIIWIDSMPLNSNGKIDKSALHTMTEK